MKAYEQVAVDFAQALLDSRNEDAHAMLVSKLAEAFTPLALGERFRRIWSGYSDEDARSLQFDEEFSLDDWRGKMEMDVGWTYVGILGDEFVEAVSVVVCDSDGTLKIREVEWGRP